MKTKPLPATMRAVAIDRFGSVKQLKLRRLPLPFVGPKDVLIRVEWAGLGEWDPFEREGGFAKLFKAKPKFPCILGSEGSGVVHAIGSRVRQFKLGERVYASAFLNPNGGFYAEYASVNEGLVAAIPAKMKAREAGVMSGVALTALRGLDDTLKLKRGETILIFGASGALGHLAVQLAKQKGARVFAVASGPAGVALAKRVGADAAVDGHKPDVLAAAQKFAPRGLDAALFVASGDSAGEAMQALRKGGRMANPTGPQKLPKAPAGVKHSVYDGNPDAELLRRLQRLPSARPLKVHVAKVFPLARAAQAHRALTKHHLGKLALRIE